MNLKQTVQAMKPTVIEYVKRNIISKDGVHLEWPIITGKGDVIIESMCVDESSFMGHVHGEPYLYLPNSFNTQIQDKYECFYTRTQLIEELAKRSVREYLKSIGANPDAVTRYWYQ